MTATSMTPSAEKHASAKEERKLRKPLIERKRRERINNCLEQLRDTVAGAFRLDQSKLEKADILEMTVKHLQNIQGSKVTDPSLGVEAQQRYSTGYIQCMHEVHTLLLSCDWMDKTLGSRLLNHLLQSLPRSQQATPTHNHAPHNHTDTLRNHANGPESPRAEPASPATLAPPTPGQGEESLCSPTPHGNRSILLGNTHLAVLEMWRPW